MSSEPLCDPPTIPLRLIHEPDVETFRIVADVFPAPVEDVTAEMNANRVRLTVDHPDGTAVRTITPPSHDRRFSDDGEAVYANGVLDVSLKTVRRTDR